MTTEMTDNKLRWVFAGFAFFVGVSYFVWLCVVYAKFMDTDRYVRATVAEHYAATVTAEAVPEDEPGSD